MARWRPPREKSSPYITPAGEKALREELKALWHKRRSEVVPALSAAAAEGDRSENAEYTYRKKQLGEIDRRVRYLSKRLDVVQVVHRAPTVTDRVYFGARVELQRADGKIVSYRIVGADETNAVSGWISVDSPLARALIGHTLDDSIQVDLPEGRQAFTIRTIEYVENGTAGP
ncbi:MAG: transcription elongation factor GreB [Gammaproteobacteria bacterium]|nr:transcription elongation factor GreB [Gammaproteobacteria bacterium]MBT8064139.1 transcription elongation factor GreB [Gammaproteobacteria bacterium]NNK31670.1 transcription elongation factor GreB [Xanthomonadales bacterium]